MSANAIQWIWSAPHQQYYYAISDGYGRIVYHWQNDHQSQPVQQPVPQPIYHPVQQQPVYQPVQQAFYQPVQYPSQEPVEQFTQQPIPRARNDSGNEDDHAIETVPEDMRPRLPDLITGTSGWAEPLDDTYFVRTGINARRFFIVGRVFAMLYSDAVGNTASVNGNDDAYSAIRFGEVVYSTIRRFIVVDVRQGFVYACGISTYSNRATLKPGCVPSEHAVVYFSGTDPRYCYVQGEREAGVTKEPIEVMPADRTLVMKPESRIRFSKTVPVEMNVKVKDIGRVHLDHMSKLVTYWQAEFNRA